MVGGLLAVGAVAGCVRDASVPRPPMVAFDSLFHASRVVPLETSDHRLGAPVGALVLGDKVVVLDQDAADAKIFLRATGRFVRAVGGPGDGPGEFRYPFAIASSTNNDFVIYDARRRLISIHDSSGAVLSEARIDPGFYNGLVVLADSTVILTGRAYSGSADVRQAQVHQFSFSGKRLRSFGKLVEPASAWDAKFTAVFASADSSRLLTSSMNSNTVTAYDLRSMRSRAFRVGRGWYSDLLYPSDRLLGAGVSPQSTVDRVAAWMHRQRMMNGVYALGRDRVLARFQAFDPDGGKFFYYVLADTLGRTLAVSRPTRVHVIMTRADTAFWVTPRAGGAASLGFGVLTDRNGVLVGAR
jgi:hypothetical protein